MSTTFSPARVASPRLAASAAELDGHFAVRRAVFVEQQKLFEDDRDAFDDRALHAVAVADGAVIGAVRLYPSWRARCGRATGWRCCRVTAPAPSSSTSPSGPRASAAGRGWSRRCRCANVRFFERLGWVCDGEPAVYRGVMHQPMAIAL